MNSSNVLDTTVSVFFFILPIVVWLLSAVIFGVLTKKLARRKGYDGYFWAGFFLLIIGLLYVGFLPVNGPMKS